MLIPKKLSHPIYATYYEDLISNSSWIVGQIYWQHTIQLAFCVAFLTFSDNQTYFCTLLFALINKYMYLIAGNISFFFVITIHTTMLWCTWIQLTRYGTDVYICLRYSTVQSQKFKTFVTWFVFNHFVIMWQWSNLLIAVFG